MTSKEVALSPWPVLGATILACTLVVGSAAARDLTISYRVTTEGLDVNQPAGARALYSRLQRAAEIVCTHGMRVGLAPVADARSSYEKALGNSIRSANLQLLTQVYLQTHTFEDAAAHGIDAPVQLAAK